MYNNKMEIIKIQEVHVKAQSHFFNLGLHLNLCLLNPEKCELILGMSMVNKLRKLHN